MLWLLHRFIFHVPLWLFDGCHLSYSLWICWRWNSFFFSKMWFISLRIACLFSVSSLSLLSFSFVRHIMIDGKLTLLFKLFSFSLLLKMTFSERFNHCFENACLICFSFKLFFLCLIDFYWMHGFSLFACLAWHSFT